MSNRIICFSLIILFLLTNIAYAQKQEKFSGTIDRIGAISVPGETGISFVDVLELKEYPNMFFIIPSKLQRDMEALKGEKVIITCKEHRVKDYWVIIKYNKSQ